MRARRGRAAVALMLCAGATLGGCSQATRHSNTMIFGTTTQFGLRAGSAATSTPEINIGYSRQEAVVMPLVANVSDDGRIQKPCALPAGPIPAGQVHPCSLVAVHGDARDSYSVLASFGAQFDGSSRAADGVGARGGLAQYFATGLAAQALALTGGASVVAAGPAAAVAAAKNPSSAEVARALFGEEAVAAGEKDRTAAAEFQERVLAKILLTDPALLNAKVTKFENDAGFPGLGTAVLCTGVEACRAAVRDNEPYRANYAGSRDKFEAAFKGWTIP